VIFLYRYDIIYLGKKADELGLVREFLLLLKSLGTVSLLLIILTNFGFFAVSNCKKRYGG
jgi:hypothetical protein